MNIAVKIIEKLEDGALVPIDEREWNEGMIAMLGHSNYLLVNDKEYEMLEGRLNVNLGTMEVLVAAVKAEG